MKSIRKFVLLLISLRVVSLFIASFLPVTGPHEWRQYDTIGMSLRYYIEFFQSQITKFPLLLPSVLQAGDNIGVTPVELPFLNLLLSPWFFFGDHLGLALAQLFLLIINIQIFHLNAKAWQDEELAGEKVNYAFYLIPIFSFTLLFFGKFMPDLLSVNLALYAMTIGTLKRRTIQAAFVGSLALMIKPTSVIVFAILLISKYRSHIKNYIWMGVSILSTLVYYKAVNPFIHSFNDQRSVFAVGMKPLSVSIDQIIEKFIHFFDIFGKNLMGRYLILVYLIALIYLLIAKKVSWKKHASIWGIIFLQWLFLHLMSGDHPFWHNYYYLGIAPLAALLFINLIEKCHLDWMRKVLMLAMAVPLLLQIFYELKPITKPNKKVSWSYRSQCKELITSTPGLPWNKGYHFRSSKELFPVLGVCFGEIQNASKTNYGFFYKKDTVPYGCRKIKSTIDLYLIDCLESHK